MKRIYLLTLIALISSEYAFADPQEFPVRKKIADLDTIVVTSSRMAQHDYKISGNVTVLTEEHIENSNAQNIADLLKNQLGIHLYDNNSLKTSTIDIRGFGDTASRNVLILINDRKVNAIDISGPDLTQIPLDSIERIEILRGAGSVLYGDNAVGGVINIITKKGRGNLHGEIGSAYGSYETLKNHLEVAGSKNDFGYYAYSQYYDTNGYRENNDYTSEDYNGRFDYKFSDKLALDLDIGWHEDDYEAPGGLNFTELRTIGRRGTANPNDYASSKDRHFKLAFDFKPWPEDLEWGNFVTDISYRNRDTYALLDFGSFGNLGTKRNLETFGVSSKYVFNEEILNHEINFVTGLDFYDTGNDILVTGSGFGDNLTISKEELGAFLYGEFETLDNLFLNAGGRYQKAIYTFDRRDVKFYDEQDPAVQVYMTGAKYEYARGSNIHLNVQQTFRFLSTDEWYDTFSGLNTSLKQQTGIQYEVGWKHNLADRAQVTVTPYWMDNKHEIFFNPTTNFFGSNSNYDKTRRIGTEIGLSGKLLDDENPWGWLSQLELFSNYSYQEPKFREGAFDKKDIPLAPRHQATGGMHLTFREEFKLSLTSAYTGAQFAINDTRNSTPPIKPSLVWDAKLGWEKSSWEIFWAVNNILNEQYYTYVVKSATSNNKDHFPASGRNFTAGMKVKF